ncbi:MAG: DUF4221 domain-containing protein [Bacteroidetes bacterium]|nr:MAG: DUF4221 domain-containing protein [Bacteroidota bacterium]
MSYLYLLIFLILSACSTKQEQKNSNSKQFEDKFTLKYKRSIKLPLDTLTSVSTISYQHFVQNGRNYYAHFNEAMKNIYVFDYDSQKLLFIVPLPKEDKAKIEIPRGFYIHNFDSIFVPSIMHQTVFLINRKGDVVKKYRYKEKVDKKDMIDVTFFFSYESAFVNNNNLYCIAGMSSKSILDIKNGKWQHIPKLPERFNEGFWVGYYYLDTYQAYNRHKNKIYCSYANLDEVYTDDASGKGKVYAGSKFFTEEAIKPFPKGNTKIPYEKRTKAFLQSPSYKNFIYDPYRKMYYRIACLPMTESEIKPKLEDNRKRHTIIVLDENMQKVGEIELPKDEYAEDIMCTQEGLNIINRKKITKNEDAIHFDVFELVE